MTDWADKPLRELRQDFLTDSTDAVPIAGMVCWAALGVASLFISERATANGALYIMVGVMPLAWLIERMRGRNLFSGGENPLTKLFLISIIGIGVTIPALVGAAGAMERPTLIVLGMALMVGAIWIPYGWAADDPVGLRRAVAQAIGCYAAYLLVPAPYTAAAICAVVVACYIYVLVAAKKMGEAA